MTDSTWLTNPANANYPDKSNWSTGVLPDGTAFFDTSTITSINVFFLSSYTVGGWTFSPAASGYVFTVAHKFTFSASGIVSFGTSPR